MLLLQKRKKGIRQGYAVLLGKNNPRQAPRCVSCWDRSAGHIWITTVLPTELLSGASVGRRCTPKGSHHPQKGLTHLQLCICPKKNGFRQLTCRWTSMTYHQLKWENWKDQDKAVCSGLQRRTYSFPATLKDVSSCARASSRACSQSLITWMPEQMMMSHTMTAHTMTGIQPNSRSES